MTTNTHSRSRGMSFGVSIAALLVLLPSAARAQTVGVRKPDAARADAMSQEAQLLIQKQSTRNWKEAARLFEDAADLRSPDDATAIRELMLAGQLRHYVGSLGRAQENLETAAELALSYGRVLESAELFLKAAFVAQERGEARDMAALAGSARRLASSPHLTQEECDCILDRFLPSLVALGRNGGR